MFFLNFFQDIGDAIVQSLRTFWGTICATIYTSIEYMYRIFNYLGRAEILENEFILGIYRKVGMVLALFMIFKLSFSLIQALIDPNKLTDKKNGYTSIISRCVIAIVLLGITPSIFREAFTLQSYIVGGNNNNNIIYKIVVGNSVSGDFKSLGRNLASEVYLDFFADNGLNNGINDQIYKNTDEDDNYDNRFEVDDYENLAENLRNGDLSFYDTVDYLSLRVHGDYVIEFHWLYMFAFGVLLLYFMVSYSIQVSIRVIQLAYLQLVAPIPILSYISDPDGSFKKWLNRCLTTYLDFFIRLAIIYFVFSVIDSVLVQFQSSSGIIFDSTGMPTDEPFIGILVKIFIIIGLLMFGKKVPELLKELFPNSGGGFDFGLKSPKKMLNDIPGSAFASKVVGYGEKKAMQVTKWAGKKAVDPLKRKYDDHKTRRKDYHDAGIALKEENKLAVEGQKLYNNYGNDVASSFKNAEYRDSYLAVEKAKEAVKNATSSVERKNAEEKLNKVKARHETLQKRYYEDARREKAYGEHKRRNPGLYAQSSSASPSTSNLNVGNNSNNSSTTSSNNEPITASNSMFSNMADSEWNERQAENNRDDYAQNSDPNDYFDKMSQIYADEYMENNGGSDEFDKSWEAQTKAMEESYKKAGWSKDNDGKWNKNS